MPTMPLIKATYFAPTTPVGTREVDQDRQVLFFGNGHSRIVIHGEFTRSRTIGTNFAGKGDGCRQGKHRNETSQGSHWGKLRVR